MYVVYTYRCLVENGGDVAFIKHSTVGENSNGKTLTLFSSQLRLYCYTTYTTPCHFSFYKGNGPEWASGVNSDDYQLVCPGKDPVAVDEFASCHLALVPAHAVVTRPETRDKVVQILQAQQVSKDLLSLLRFGFFFCNSWTFTE